MREIKFRGLTKENKFAYGYYFLWKKRNKFLHIIGDGVQNGSVNGNEVDLKTISQYTGLKDIDGEEIYEGDIVKVFESKFRKDNNSYIIGSISYSAPNYLFFEKHKVASIVKNISNVYEIKILGNIYLNPELLEVK